MEKNIEEYPKAYLYRRIVQAKLFIDERFYDHIDLDDIAGEAYFSKFHFIRLFRKCYGKTPHHYLRDKRLEKAKERLSLSNLPIEEICALVGFESLGSFSMLFKKHTGYAPGQFRTLANERHQTIKVKPLLFVPGCFALARGWTGKSNFEEMKGTSS